MLAVLLSLAASLVVLAPPGAPPPLAGDSTADAAVSVLHVLPARAAAADRSPAGYEREVGLARATLRALTAFVAELDAGERVGKRVLVWAPSSRTDAHPRESFDWTHRLNTPLKKHADLDADLLAEVEAAALAALAVESVDVVLERNNSAFVSVFGDPHLQDWARRDLTRFSTGATLRLLDLLGLNQTLQGFVLGQGRRMRVYDREQFEEKRPDWTAPRDEFEWPEWAPSADVAEPGVLVDAGCGGEAVWDAIPYGIRASSSSSSSSPAQFELPTEPVPVRVLGEGGEFSVADLIRDSEPVLVRGSFVGAWPALSNWTRDGLRRALAGRVLGGVKSSARHRLFFQADNVTMHHFTVRNMSAEAFFDEWESKSPEQSLYWFGRVPEPLAHDVSERSEALFWKDDDRERRNQFLWLSTAGVQHHLHMDLDHNVFVQVRGRKRFTLLPSSEWDRLYDFPRLHPMWHKSQVSLESPDLARFPRFAGVRGAQVAELGPGDVLYVPPLTWHFVEALTDSVSLSTWSNGDAYAAIHAIYGFELRLDSMASAEGRLYALRLLLEFVVRQLHGPMDIEWYFRRLATVRYGAARGLAEGEESTELRERCLQRMPMARHVVEASTFDATVLVQHLAKLRVEIRDVVLADWIEQAAAGVVGAQNVRALIFYCFRDATREYEIVDPGRAGELFAAR